MSEFTAEILGTMVLIIFGGGVVATNGLFKSKGNGGGWVLISLGWGLAVTMGVYAVGNISGAHLNPAVTLGFAISGDFPWSKVPEFISAQMIGAIIGATVVYFAFLPHWRATKDKGAKLAVFSTDPAINSPLSNLVTEMIGTFALVFGLLFIGVNEFTQGLNPLVVGLLIVAIGMSLGGPTGYAINPARDLGPRIAHALLPIPGKGSSNWWYAWIPVLGPILGGMYGGVFYKGFYEGSFSAPFWIGSIIVAVIFVSAATIEVKKAKMADEDELKGNTASKAV